jgi:hypothetical protein
MFGTCCNRAGSDCAHSSQAACVLLLALQGRRRLSGTARTQIADRDPESNDALSQAPCPLVGLFARRQGRAKHAMSGSPALTSVVALSLAVDSINRTIE